MLDQKLTDWDFEKISSFVYKQVGIKLPLIKKGMVEGRLKKRLRAINFSCFKSYTKFVLGQKGQSEVLYLIDAITTNKTNFFREIKHFYYLTDRLLPQLISEGIGKKRPLRIWSAGCSTGEEPYTLAMVLHEWNRSHTPIDFSILATDISFSVLQKAKRAIYTKKDIAPVPLSMKQAYILRKNDNDDVVKMSSLLRDKITFKSLNLKDEHYNIPHKMDIIFCRNVMIYFDNTTQTTIINSYAKNMVSGGHLFLGHSESINGLNVPFSSVANTVYQKNS